MISSRITIWPAEASWYCRIGSSSSSRSSDFPLGGASSLYARRKGAVRIFLHNSLSRWSVEDASAKDLRRSRYFSELCKTPRRRAGSLHAICATSNLVGSLLAPHWNKNAFASGPKSTKSKMSPYVVEAPRYTREGL